MSVFPPPPPSSFYRVSVSAEPLPAMPPDASASGGNLGDLDAAELRKAAEGFEAVFVRQILSAARASHFGGDALFGGQSDETFHEMRDARFADLAASSRAFGLADMIEAHLARQIGADVKSGEG